MTKRYFVHGRFQPFHLDHLRYILEALKRYERVGVGLTGILWTDVVSPSEPSHRRVPTCNPFTYVQRAEMILLSLLQEGISADRVFFVPFPIEAPELLPQIVGTDAVMLTTIRDDWNIQKVKTLESFGYQVEILYEDYNKIISGSGIRRMLAAGDNAWRNLVPAAVAGYIHDHCSLSF